MICKINLSIFLIICCARVCWLMRCELMLKDTHRSTPRCAHSHRYVLMWEWMRSLLMMITEVLCNIYKGPLELLYRQSWNSKMKSVENRSLLLMKSAILFISSVSTYRKYCIHEQLIFFLASLWKCTDFGLSNCKYLWLFDGLRYNLPNLPLGWWRN